MTSPTELVGLGIRVVSTTAGVVGTVYGYKDI